MIVERNNDRAGNSRYAANPERRLGKPTRNMVRICFRFMENAGFFDNVDDAVAVAVDGTMVLLASSIVPGTLEAFSTRLRGRRFVILSISCPCLSTIEEPKPSPSIRVASSSPFVDDDRNRQVEE